MIGRYCMLSRRTRRTTRRPPPWQVHPCAPWLPSRARPVYGNRGTREELTSAVEYEGAPAPVRQDLREAHRFFLDHIRSPGTWWTGAGRDYFARALGVEPLRLPRPLAGEPSRHRPAGAKEGGAWVPLIDPADAAGPEADLYGGGDFVPNIVRALSLVPDEVRVLRRST